MAEDNLQKHLDHSMYGKSFLKPDEQKKYMGTFRERCYATMTISQMKKEENKHNFFIEAAKDQQASVLLNGSIDNSLQAVYIKLLNQKNIPFTIINENVSNTPESLGIILAAPQAVNEQVIDIENKYPEKETADTNQTVKKGFWHRFF